MKPRNLSTSKSRLMFVFLVLISITGNYFGIPLFFGINFLFGSIGLLIIAYFYGVILATAVAVIAGIGTYFLWEHWYAAIIFSLEILFVGLNLLRFQRKQGFANVSNLFLIDGLYWVTIGMLLVWLFYFGVMHIDIQATLLIMLKQSVNGLFNALLATIVLLYFPFDKWMAISSHKKEPIHIKDIIFRLTLSFILFTTILLMVINSRNEFQKMSKGIQSTLQAEHTQIATTVDSWLREQMHTIDALAEVGANSSMEPSDELQQSTELIKKAHPNFHNMYIANESGTTIAFYPAVNENGASTIGLNFSDRQYYKDLKATLQPVISDVFLGRGGVFNSIVTLSVPIVKDKSFRGFALGALNLEQMITDVLGRVGSSHNTIDEITIVDRIGNVIASTLPDVKPMERFELGKNEELRSLGNGIFHLLPKGENLSTMVRWGQSSYVLQKPISDEVPWSMILKISLALYRDNLYSLYTNTFAVILVFIAIALLAAIILSRRMAEPLSQLCQITTNLPEKVLNQQGIEWPTTRVLEMDGLIKNFKSMASTLSHSFGELEDANRKLKYLANYDSLTDLANRCLFSDELQNELNKAARDGQSVAVLFLDLDNFKDTNDTLGHQMGDELLKIVARRLQVCLGNQRSIISRQGGDEFIMMLSGNIQRQDIQFVIRKMLRCISEPFSIDNFEINLTASIGVSLYPNDGDDVNSLITNADIAMFRAKEQGGNRYLFHSSDMNVQISERLQLGNDLLKAMEKEQFLLYYQPKVDLNSGKIKGTEALVRWQHPKLGLLWPSRFLSVAEETGQIVPITEWVLYAACKQIMTWQKEGYPPIQVAVNFSAKQFQRNNPAEEVIKRVLKETKLHPNCLMVEITENFMMQNVEYTTQALHAIKDLGVQVALDDFGTGYSSLSYLKQFPIDEIKIDRSFVKDVVAEKETGYITEAIISLAHLLKLQVTAEGVETEEQLEFFRQRKCDLVQGYFFSKPIPADRFQQLLTKNNLLTRMSC